MSFRTYHQVAGDDRSHLLEQVLAQRARIVARLAGVARTIAIMSGKGGVGKSFIAALLASGAARRLAGGVGVLDADLKSPTVARMLGARGPVRVDESGVHPAVTPDGLRVMSTELFLPEGAPLAWREHAGERFVWRGVLETGALREFLSDVVWGSLDLLLIDLPPGADKLSDLSELLPSLTGAIAVTIPSKESRASVERAMHDARRLQVPLLGIVENMSGYACAGCDRTQPLFAGDAGATLAREFDVPLLAQLPFRAADDAATVHPDFLSAIDGMLSLLLPRGSVRA